LVEKKKKEDAEAFSLCARKGETEALVGYLDQGVDVNYQNAYGQTALHRAAMHGRAEAEDDDCAKVSAECVVSAVHRHPTHPTTCLMPLLRPGPIPMMPEFNQRDLPT